VNWLYRTLPTPSIPTRLLAVTLFFTVYFYVPTVRSCDKPLVWFNNGGIVDAYCIEPVFRVQCVASSRLFDQGMAVYRCRTWWNRPVKVIDRPKLEYRRCQAELGWLSNYAPDRGCFCDYHSVELRGICRLTDDACSMLYGTGSIAVATNAAGYDDQCHCPSPADSGSQFSGCWDRTPIVPGGRVE
jgi:hypothetical protein